MLGPAFEFFGNYEAIEDERTGDKIDIARWMDIVRKKVIQLQLQQIMSEFLEKSQKASLTSIDMFTQFYILYRLRYGSKVVEMDTARTLEKATNMNLTDLIKWGYLKKNQGDIELLHAEQRNNPEDLLTNKLEGKLITLIDTLHGAVLAHEKGIFEDYARRNNLTPEHPLWSAAQLISSILPANAREGTTLKNLLNVRKLRGSSELTPFYQ